MAKFPFTADGIQAFCARAYQSDHLTLSALALEAAADSPAFLAAHFELPVEQLEFIRGLDQTVLTLFGMSLGLALSAKRPISLRLMRDKGWCILINSQLSAHFSGDGLSGSGQLDITITLSE